MFFLFKIGEYYNSITVLVSIKQINECKDKQNKQTVHKYYTKKF